MVTIFLMHGKQHLNVFCFRFLLPWRWTIVKLIPSWQRGLKVCFFSLKGSKGVHVLMHEERCIFRSFLKSLREPSYILGDFRFWIVSLKAQIESILHRVFRIMQKILVTNRQTPTEKQSRSYGFLVESFLLPHQSVV